MPLIIVADLEIRASLRSRFILLELKRGNCLIKFVNLSRSIASIIAYHVFWKRVIANCVCCKYDIRMNCMHVDYDPNEHVYDDAAK